MQVDKLLGPGNQYVTAAKMLLQNSEAMVSIDMPAGPSEVLVIADASANPAFVAADLLSQAEHGPDSQVRCSAASSGHSTRCGDALTEQSGAGVALSFPGNGAAPSKTALFLRCLFVTVRLTGRRPAEMVLHVWLGRYEGSCGHSYLIMRLSACLNVLAGGVGGAPRVGPGQGRERGAEPV